MTNIMLYSRGIETWYNRDLEGWGLGEWRGVVQEWDHKRWGTSWRWRSHNYKQLSKGQLQKHRPGAKLVLAVKREQRHIFLYLAYIKSIKYSNFAYNMELQIIERTETV